MALTPWVFIVALVGAVSVAGAQTPPPKPAARKPAASAPGKPGPGPADAAGPAAPGLVKAGFNVSIGPAPAWVNAVPLPGGAPTEAAPMHYRLIDEQVRIEPNTSAEHVRLVRVVNQAAGLGTAAQFELEYDPAHESLVLHRLEVVRDGQRLQRLDRKRIELLQREKQLEQRIYDGRVTASILVEDVRVGDEIDMAYTRVGQNPVFGARFVRNGWMSSHKGPVRLYTTRLLAPAGRNIRQALGPADATVSTQVVNGWRDTLFRRENAPQLRFEPGVPFSAFRNEHLQLSEFADWAEVAAWGEQLFREAASGPRSAATEAKAAEIRAAHATPAARALEALRFVQQDVRYFGVEMGPSSHRPHPADQVLQQRFGDCKDKVTLLTALLRALDLPVRPVLVNTRLRERMEGWIPSPLAFDHVIARVDVDGQPLFLDPTRGHQSGPLARRQSIGLGQGLELAPGAAELVALPKPYDQERMRVEDRLVVKHFAEPVQLESRIVYRGDMAEGLREAIAVQGLATVADALSGAYVKAYPQLKRLAPPEAQPVPDDDALALVQRFELPGFWRYVDERALSADVVQWAPAEMLLPPKMEARRQPLAFNYPGIVRHRLTVQFPEQVYRQSGQRRSDDGDQHFRLLVKVDASLDSVSFDVEARLNTDQIEAAQWQAFNAQLAKALPKLGSVVAFAVIPQNRLDSLQAELKQLEEDIRRGRLKATTATQLRSHIKVASLAAQLDSGRLAGPLKAQALVARGIAFDHLGRLDAARSDFEAAMLQDPTSLEAQNAAATNAQGRGDHDRAVALASQVLAKQPKESQALITRALAHYMAGRLPEARADLTLALEDRSNVQRGYPLALLALTTRRSGGNLDELKARFPRDHWPTEWPRQLVVQAVEGGDPGSLISAAKAHKQSLEALTETHFYLGEMAAASGDMGLARKHWQNAVDLGVVEYVEHNAARQRLRAAQ